MKVELQTKLFERYPLTLRKPCEGGEEEDNPGANRPGPLDFWGIECGDGWFELLDRLLADFEKHNQKLRKQGKTKGQWPRVLQIKEKFGSLRVYIAPYQAVTPKLHEAMVAAEQASNTTCEMCGGEGEFHKDGYLRVICVPCAQQPGQEDFDYDAFEAQVQQLLAQRVV